MPTLNLNTAARTAMAQAIITEAGQGALLRIYDGSKPAAGGAATNLLCELGFGVGDNIGTAGTGALSLNVTNLSAEAVLDGTATWARIVKSDGTSWVMDMDVTSTGVGTGALQLDNVAIELGGTVTITASTITMPNRITE